MLSRSLLTISERRVRLRRRPISRLPHASPATTSTFATAIPSAILAPMPTQEIHTTQPGRIAQDGNDASKAMTARFGNLNP